MTKIKPITIQIRGKLAERLQGLADGAGVKVQIFILNILEAESSGEAPEKKKPTKTQGAAPTQLRSDRGRAPHPNCDCTVLCQLENAK